jgi:ActR/RegA family two-component response regulator
MLSVESDFNVVASCRDAKTCMEVIRDQSPNLALLDTSLLDLSGLQLLASIKSEHLCTRVVFFSLSLESQETATAIARGAYGHYSQGGDVRAASALLAEGRVRAESVATRKLGYQTAEGAQIRPTRHPGELANCPDYARTPNHTSGLRRAVEQRGRTPAPRVRWDHRGPPSSYLSEACDPESNGVGSVGFTRFDVLRTLA